MSFIYCTQAGSGEAVLVQTQNLEYVSVRREGKSNYLVFHFPDRELAVQESYQDLAKALNLTSAKMEIIEKQIKRLNQAQEYKK